MRCIGYTRVSTQEQADSRAGLEAQQHTIRQGCEVRGVELVAEIEDAGFSAASMERPGIQNAMALLAAGRADALMVAKLDRLSRSMVDFAMLMERARREGWNLIALDLGVDSSTPSGEMLANVLLSFAQFERRLIGQRTREALQQKKAQGIRLGRRRQIPQDVVQTIVALRGQGRTFAGIASELDVLGIPTVGGSPRWSPSTVRAVHQYATTN